jgi:hypothetical protein
MSSSIALAGGPDDPFADEVVEYEEGLNPSAGFTNPEAALGQPERFSGEGTPFPAAVTPFSPPFGTDEIVSIGASGWITLRFSTPIRDDPANPFGIDLIIFGNAGFIDGDYPNGIVAGLFGNDGGLVEVSHNGIDWTLIPDAKADTLFPTQGWLDNDGPFDINPGTIPSNFQLPVDPSLELRDVIDLDYEQLVDLYNGSGGGAGLDISVTGLSQITHVRIFNPLDGDGAFEIDAVVDARNPADLGHDGVVGPQDLASLLATWGPTQAGAPADLNFDGIVNTPDLAQLLAAWTSR